MKSKLKSYKLIVQEKAYYVESQALALAKLIEIFDASNQEFTDWLAMKKGKRVRLIGKEPEDLRLHSDRSDLVEKYAIQLRTGWWMYKLWSGDKVLKLMDACCAKMHLKFGSDVRVDLMDWGYPNFVSTAINIEDLL